MYIVLAAVHVPGLVPGRPRQAAGQPSVQPGDPRRPDPRQTEPRAQDLHLPLPRHAAGDSISSSLNIFTLQNKYFQEETRHSKGQQQTVPDPVKTAASIPSKQPRPDPEARLYPRDQVLYCTVLYCTVLYCTVLYCTVSA